MRPDEAITEITEEEIREVRARRKFVPGFNNDVDDLTHLTTGLLKTVALCGQAHILYIGETDSGRYCPGCVTEARERVK